MARIVGQFNFGLVLTQTDEGDARIELHLINDGIPEEFVLAKMRAQLRKMEDEYFSSYLQEF